MPVNVATNIAIRERVRADLLLPRPVDLAGEAGIEDLTAEQLERLDKLRLFNTRFLAAIKSGNPSAIEETRPKPAAGLPRGTGRLFTFAGDNAQNSPQDTIFFGPIDFPYIIRELVVTAMDAAVAPAQGAVAVELFTSGEGPTALNRRPAGGRIWPEDPASANTANVLITGSSGPVSVRYPVGVPVLSPGLYLAVFFLVTAATLDVSAAVTIEEVSGFGPAVYGDLIPIGRRNINPSTRPPPPRSITPSVPRGATIRVTSGGQVIAQRIIAWESLAPEIKRLWFNQQVGAPPDPSVQWLL